MNGLPRFATLNAGKGCGAPTTTWSYCGGASDRGLRGIEYFGGVPRPLSDRRFYAPPDGF